MKKNASDYLVAISVIVCSLVLLAALTYALGGWRPSNRGHTLEVDFVDVTGVKLHSDVRYAGAHAGTVTNIRHLTDEERAALPAEKRRNAVRVTLSLEEKLVPLPGDILVGISSDTMLSDKFVALTGGSPDAPRLADGTLLQGRSGGGLDDLINAVGPFSRKRRRSLRVSSLSSGRRVMPWTH
jgi:ABC-type transporter Mla subunit MlaD